jgi:dolichol kinase
LRATIHITFRAFALSRFRDSFLQSLVLFVSLVFFCLPDRVRRIRLIRGFHPLVLAPPRCVFRGLFCLWLRPPAPVLPKKFPEILPKNPKFLPAFRLKLQLPLGEEQRHARKTKSAEIAHSAAAFPA